MARGGKRYWEKNGSIKTLQSVQGIFGRAHETHWLPNWPIHHRRPWPQGCASPPTTHQKKKKKKKQIHTRSTRVTFKNRNLRCLTTVDTAVKDSSRNLVLGNNNNSSLFKNDLTETGVTFSQLPPSGQRRKRGERSGRNSVDKLGRINCDQM